MRPHLSIRYLSNTASSVLCIVYSVKDHHTLLHYSPLMKKPYVRQVVLYIYIYIYIYIYTYTSVSLSLYIYIYINNIYLSLSLYTYIYIYIHTHIVRQVVPPASCATRSFARSSFALKCSGWFSSSFR